MKKTIILTALVVPLFAYSQKSKRVVIPDSIITKSGWVIHEGDTIRIGMGTMPNGDFKFISFSGVRLTNATPWSPNAKKRNAESNAMDRTRANISVAIENIHRGSLFFRHKGYYKIYADLAIESGEIIIPSQYRKQPQTSAPISKADELTKLKKLLDDGVLTKEEFEAEKKKILDKK